MTSAELRRQAGRQRAAAADLAADAGRLRSQAATLRGSLDPLVPMSQRVWVGPAALDFESEARRRGAEVDGQAARLSAIAGDLDRRAAVARSTANNLESQATAAAVAEAAAASVSAEIPAAGVI